mgnify:CR=1 FL=1|jgi:hypothetical protein
MRLIDADRLMTVIKPHKDSVFFQYEILDFIKEQPTIKQWHKLTFRPLTDEEKEEYANQEWTYMIDGLPDLGEDVIVTNGTNAWVDSFDIDDFVYLSGTDNDIDGVIAWMEIPSYKEEQ